MLPVKPTLAKKAKHKPNHAFCDVKKLMLAVLIAPIIINVRMNTFLRPVRSAMAAKYGERIEMVKKEAAMT
jgi:hypothetical protein